jgi:hypothetical protein
MINREQRAGWPAVRMRRQIPAIWQDEFMAELINRATRYDLEFPVRYRPLGALKWRQGKTTNISRSGVLFWPEEGDEAIGTGSMLEVMLTLAPEGQAAKVEVLCRGPVVRCESGEERAAALAVRIARYRMGATEIVGEA